MSRSGEKVMAAHFVRKSIRLGHLMAEGEALTDAVIARDARITELERERDEARAEVARLRKDCGDALDALQSTDHRVDADHGRCVVCSQRWPCETGEAAALLLTAQGAGA